ncbi:MAG: hypothetical protein GHCLOJNM_02787 [bacterium]|nr:hypothetical protein [bacterium]
MGTRAEIRKGCLLILMVIGGILFPMRSLAVDVNLPPFDIAPFALPNCPPGEFIFEEPRDIRRVVVSFKQDAPVQLGVSYLQNTWPKSRFEAMRPFDNPCTFGWFPIDDWFNSEWKAANTRIERIDPRTLSITFQPLSSEFESLEDYDVTIRRTLGIRIDPTEMERIEKVEIHTVSPPVETRGVRVELDAGSRTPGEGIEISGYNVEIQRAAPEQGVEVEGLAVRLGSAPKRSFLLNIRHMQPAHYFSGDDGHVTFSWGEEAFTISLSQLAQEGPIWFEELGVYLTAPARRETFEEYQRRIEGDKTINGRVLEHEEQSLGGAMNGQPARHRVAQHLGCKYARERFWVEPSGDILLREGDLHRIPGKDTERYKVEGDARFFFGLERWIVREWSSDPGPILSSNLKVEKDSLEVRQKVVVVPLDLSDLKTGHAPDDPMVALARFTFTNTGRESARAELPIRFSSNSRRSENRFSARRGGYSGNLIPLGDFDPLTLREDCLYSDWKGENVLRLRYQTAMTATLHGEGVLFSRELPPGASCELALKIPYIALESEEEFAKLKSLEFESADREASAAWVESSGGARVKTPEPILDSVHAAHLSHVFLTDIPMPDDPDLINTSVGTSVYGNFANESCMIIHDLDERGLHEEARRRLDLWIKYQGTVGTLGNFTDHDGVFFGAGGFEHGHTYNQHHGWVLWCLAEHYFLSGDTDWLRKVAEPMVKGVEWVFRQRKETMKPRPCSRGWEYGFLPEGALEDVGDYFYWLSTNALTWRGVDSAAKALAAIDHPEAARLQGEADAYRRDLIRGFETMRKHTPLARLRNGRWVPIYPSRLYLRGRDIGWIREILEGSVYLLISGLYPVEGKEAKWILDDFQDNRYMNPPFGYPVPDPEAAWFDHGGLSIQPNLLAGLMPHLDRDEPEIFLWMFFNCWAACYSPELNGMVEHPHPFLGFSNTAQFKTSDEANATSWLRSMFVYARGDLLHFGRALPREWFAQETPLSAEGVVTRFGKVSVTYEPLSPEGVIRAELDLGLRSAPGKALIRFRHPEASPIRSVRLNGKESERFDPVKGDVEITGLDGRITVEARF